MKRQSMIRRAVVAALGDVLYVGLRLPGAWVPVVVALPAVVVGTVVVASVVARVRREVFDG